MINEELIKNLKSEFENKESFAKGELMIVLKKNLIGSANKNTLTWRIHDLVTRGMVHHQ